MLHCGEGERERKGDSGSEIEGERALVTQIYSLLEEQLRGI